MVNRISILGCGWLGKPLGEALAKLGYSVAGSTTTESKLKDLALSGIQPFLVSFSPALVGNSDFFKSELLIVAIPPKRKTGDPDFYYQQVQEIVKECLNGDIRKVVFISSTSVYPDLNRVVTEEDPTLTEEESVLVKAENHFRSQKEIQTTIIRFAGLLGPGRHPGKFLANKTGVPGGNLPVNLIHLQDCIEIVSRLVENDQLGKVYNACADSHPTKQEFYTAAANAIGVNPPVFLPEEINTYKIISSEKIKKELKYQFIYPDLLNALN